MSGDITEREILAAVAAGEVADNDAALPLLVVDGRQIPVADEVWRLYRLGWLHQLEGERLWRLTFRGRDVLQGRTDG